LDLQVQRAKELNYAQTPQDEAKEEQETAEDDWDEAEASKILQMQRQQIVQLRQQIELSQQTLVKVQENPQAQ
jgi:DNA-binding transcriptional regulator YiaG